MNKWKFGFWICLTLLIAVTSVGLYSIVDQAVTLTYLRDSFNDTESDLNTLIRLVNDTDLTKNQIKENLKSHDLFEFMDFSKDEIRFKRPTLSFTGDKLTSIKKQW